MRLNAVYDMIQTIEKCDLGKLCLEDKMIEERLNLICNFVTNLLMEYQEELKILDSTNVRFCDYYDMGMFHGEDIIKYFNDNYNGKDKEVLTDVFVIYVILKNAQEIVYNYDISESPYELYRFLDCGNYFEDILEMINYLQKKRMVKEFDNQPEFLNPSNKYKILFSGLALEDIKSLEKNVKKIFVKKISGQLSKSDCVTLSESIDHVKSAYDFPIMRVQFADDYRIAYIRKDGVTVILGVSIKSGKEKDYNRYDSVAKKKDLIYQEIQMFKNGQLPISSQHYRTLQYLLDFYSKTMLKEETKNSKHTK